MVAGLATDAADDARDETTEAAEEMADATEPVAVEARELNDEATEESADAAEEARLVLVVDALEVVARELVVATTGTTVVLARLDVAAMLVELALGSSVRRPLVQPYREGR